jgi:hypothetical protein
MLLAAVFFVVADPLLFSHYAFAGLTGFLLARNEKKYG